MPKFFLKNCKSFRKKYRRAVKRKKLVTSEDQSHLECLSGYRDWLTVPIASNLRLRAKIAELSLTFYTTLAKVEGIEMGHVTLISRDFETGSESTDIDLGGMQKAFRPTLNAIFPHYIAVAEHHMFTNVNHASDGKLVTPHVHVVGWGPSIKATAELAVLKHKKRFQTRFEGVEGLQLDWIALDPLDLARIAYYPWKAPHRCKTLYLNVDKGKANLHESEANDRYVDYLRHPHVVAPMAERTAAFRIVGRSFGWQQWAQSGHSVPSWHFHSFAMSEGP